MNIAASNNSPEIIIVAIQLSSGKFMYKLWQNLDSSYDEDTNKWHALNSKINADYQSQPQDWGASLQDAYNQHASPSLINRVDVIVAPAGELPLLPAKKQQLDIQKPNNINNLSFNVYMLASTMHKCSVNLSNNNIVSECFIYRRSLTTADIKHYAENSKKLKLHSCELNDVNLSGYNFKTPVSFIGSLAGSINFNSGRE